MINFTFELDVGNPILAIYAGIQSEFIVEKFGYM